MINNIPKRRQFSSILFSCPSTFDISYDINPYMDTNYEIENYKQQWENCLEKIKEYTNIEVVDYNNYKIEGTSIDKLNDIVFVANHGLGIPGTNKIILSNMKNKEREDEIRYFRKWCDNNGYETIELNSSGSFEGEGDGIWHPKKDLLWLGYGYRSDYEAITQIEEIVNSRTIKLELTDEMYYHLDVCFTPLSARDVLIIPDAFTSESLNKIENVFENVYYVPDSEKNTFACNSTYISENMIAIDKINNKTIELLKDLKYNVIEVNTKDYRKAGGSIDCITLNIP